MCVNQNSTRITDYNNITSSNEINNTSNTNNTLKDEQQIIILNNVIKNLTARIDKLEDQKQKYKKKIRRITAYRKLEFILYL